MSFHIRIQKTPATDTEPARLEILEHSSAHGIPDGAILEIAGHIVPLPAVGDLGDEHPAGERGTGLEVVALESLEHVPALVAALRKAEAQVAAVLALCDEREGGVSPGILPVLPTWLVRAAIDATEACDTCHGRGGIELHCDDCHQPYAVWSAENPIWNLVIGGPDPQDDPGGMLCPRCFTLRAKAVLDHPIWDLMLHRAAGDGA